MSTPIIRLFGVIVLLFALVGSFVRRRYRAWGYLERDEDLLVRRGVMVRRLSVVPYGRMQLVEVTAGVLERIFGISTVRLHTAAARSDGQRRRTLRRSCNRPNASFAIWPTT